MILFINREFAVNPRRHAMSSPPVKVKIVCCFSLFKVHSILSNTSKRPAKMSQKRPNEEYLEFLEFQSYKRQKKEYEQQLEYEYRLLHTSHEQESQKW